MSTTCRSPARVRTTGRSRVSNDNRGRFPLRPCRHGRAASSRKIIVRIGDRPDSGMPAFQRRRENSMFKHPEASASRRFRASGRARTGFCPGRRPRVASSPLGWGRPVRDCRAFRWSRENSAFQDPGAFASRRNRALDPMRTGSSLVRGPRAGLEAKSPSRRVAAPASPFARFRRTTRPASAWAAELRAAEDGP